MTDDAAQSESELWAQAGASLIQGLAAGIKQAADHRAGLIASGLAPEEAQAAMLRDLILNADPAMLEYSRGVVMRSFGTLYEDGGEDPTDTPPSAAGP